MAKTPKYICPNCGTTTNRPRRATRGNMGIELLLWLCLILPGLAYSLWRSTTRYKICPTCKSPEIIPTATPRGQKLLNE